MKALLRILSAAALISSALITPFALASPPLVTQSSVGELNAALSTFGPNVLTAAIGSGPLYDPINPNKRDILMSLSYMGNIQTATTILDIGLVWPAIWSGASLNVDSTANTASFAGFPAFPTILLNGVSSSFSDVYVSVTAGGGATRVDLGLDGTRVARLEGNRYQPIDIVHLSGLTTPAFQLSGSATFDWCCQDSWRPGTMTIYAMPAVAAVPEPQSYALFASGLGLIGVFARRRARQLGQSSFPT